MTRSPSQAYVIDGYNFMAFFLPDNPEGISLEERRVKMLEALSNHAGRLGIQVFVVFDGLPGIAPETLAPPHVQVLFSEQAHGADQVIERLVRELSVFSPTYVVTGDYLQQQLIFGKNVMRKPPRELALEMTQLPESSNRRPSWPAVKSGYRLEDRLGKEALEGLKLRIQGQKKRRGEEKNEDQSDEEGD